MFANDEYLIRRKVFKIFGGAFHLYDTDMQVVAYCKMKAFKLKEDLRVYSDETESTELIRIKARSIIDFGATYDVFDSATDTHLGAMRRKGLKSILRDEWLILDTNDEQIGRIQEDSQMLALIRRFLTNLIPQDYHCEIDGARAMTLKQNFNPFVMKIRLRFEQWPEDLSRQMAVAAGILLCAIEGKQG